MDEELLELLFRQAGTPVRRVLRLHLTRDLDGNPSLEALGLEAVFLSEEESVNSLEITRERFHSCGCSTESPVGSICMEPGCGRVSCVNCTIECKLCLKKICRVEHVQWIVNSNGDRAALCENCATEVSWKSLTSKVTLGLISPPRL